MQYRKWQAIFEDAGWEFVMGDHLQSIYVFRKHEFTLNVTTNGAHSIVTATVNRNGAQIGAMNEIPEALGVIRWADDVVKTRINGSEKEFEAFIRNAKSSNHNISLDTFSKLYFEFYKNSEPVNNVDDFRRFVGSVHIQYQNYLKEN